jgi:hypothetical protein
MRDFSTLEVNAPATAGAKVTTTPATAPEAPKDLNLEAFGNEHGLILPKGRAAGIDDEGVYRTALGHEATAQHRNVARVWQDQCTPVTDFFTQVVLSDMGKTDVSVPVHTMAFDLMPTTGKIAMHNGDERYRLTPDALGQSARLSGVHMEVVKHFCKSERPQMACDELNLGLSRARASMALDATKTVRIRKDRAPLADGQLVARAVLSPGYDERLDNTTAMSMILESLPTEDLKSVLCSHLREDGDTLIGNLLLPDTMKDCPDGAYGVGLAFGNSEIGDGSYWVDPFVFQAICVNGNIWSRRNSTLNARQRHAGINFDELRANVKIAIENALSGGHKLIELMQRSREVKIEAATASNLIAYLAQQENLTRQAANSWYLAFQNEPQDNALGIVNGLTKAAQDFTGYARKEMEQTAMKVLAPSLESDLRSIVSRWERYEGSANEMPVEEVQRYVTVATA